MIKDKFLKLIYNKLDSLKIDNLYLGVLIKSIHFNLPGMCLFVILFFKKKYAILALIYITFVIILYKYYNNCFITIIENELLKDYQHLKDLNVVDPLLDIFELEINNRNRKYISIFVFIFYYLFVLSIFVFRFFLNR